MQWFRFKRWATFEQAFTDSSLPTDDNYEALTNPYGTEIWRGVPCSRHGDIEARNGLSPCAVLVWKVSPQRSHVFALHLLQAALREMGFFDGELLELALDRIALDVSDSTITPLHVKTAEKMVGVDPESTPFKALRLIQRFARTRCRHTDEGWRAPFAEFVVEACASSGGARSIVDKHAVSLLMTREFKAVKAEVVASVAKQLAEARKLASK